MKTDLNLASDPQAEARRSAQYVEKDRDRLGGEPVFRGTRVPVKSLFDHLSGGDSSETFPDDSPGITRGQVQTVVELAELHLLGDVQTFNKTRGRLNRVNSGGLDKSQD